MKSFLMLLSGCLIATASLRATLPQVKITSDTTLSGTVEVTEQLIVTNNATVTVEPGTVFRVHNTSIWIDSGSIVVNGEEGDSVYFQPVDTNGWDGIGIVDSANSSHFSYVVIEGALEFSSVLFFADGAEVTVKHCDIRNNHGGIFLADSRLTIDSSRITGSTTYRGIDAYNSTLSLKTTFVTENMGGGINASNSDLTIKDHSSISSNYTESTDGAGISGANSNIVIENSEIIGNTTYGSGGGGIYAYGDTNTVVMKNVLIASNRTGKNGSYGRAGGASLHGIDAELEDVGFWGNSASEEGGALTYYGRQSGGNLSVNRCFFINNSVTNDSQKRGADVAVYSTVGVEILNSLFDNSTGAYSTYVWGKDQSDEFYMVNNTFLNCEGGIEVDSGTSITVANSLINTVGSKEFSVHDSAVLTEIGNMVNRDDHGLLKLNSKPYYQIELGSPCIDASTLFSGVDLGELDLTGNPRDRGERVDVGAYEFHDGVSVSSIHSTAGASALTVLGNNRIAISSSTDQQVVKIMTLSGRTVYSRELAPGESTMTVPDGVASGIYVISLIRDGFTETVPMMIR